MRIYHGKIISLDTSNTTYRYMVEDQGQITYVSDALPADLKIPILWWNQARGYCCRLLVMDTCTSQIGPLSRPPTLM